MRQINISLAVAKGSDLFKEATTKLMVKRIGKRSDSQGNKVRDGTASYKSSSPDRWLDGCKSLGFDMKKVTGLPAGDKAVEWRGKKATCEITIRWFAAEKTTWIGVRDTQEITDQSSPEVYHMTQQKMLAFKQSEKDKWSTASRKKNSNGELMIYSSLWVKGNGDKMYSAQIKKLGYAVKSDNTGATAQRVAYENPKAGTRLVVDISGVKTDDPTTRFILVTPGTKAALKEL